MRVLYVADGRSPIARSWIEGMVAQGVEAHLATTFRCEPIPDLASLELVPVAFSGIKKRASGGSSGGGVGWRSTVRQLLGPWTVPWSARRLRTAAQKVEPDLLHALRIPFEGMMATWTPMAVPVLVSSWGNDFTLHAPSTRGMGWMTRRTMAATDGLHADCQRDLRLAGEWGLPAGTPRIVLPGNGGLDPIFLADEIEPLPEGSRVAELLNSVPSESPLVVNPRGFRAYVRNDTFFRSIPQVLAERPGVRFLCPSMAGDPLAREWIDRLKVEDAVALLGKLEPLEMAHLFRRSQVAVSPSEHDGTPNTLLEAMACGAFPIAGALESVGEWIESGENGLLIDPAKPADLARAILHVLADDGLRRRATEHNRRLVATRARREDVTGAALRFYQRVLDEARSE